MYICLFIYPSYFSFCNVKIQHSYRWATENTALVRKAFDAKASANLRNAMMYARQDLQNALDKGITDFRVSWIGEQYWPVLVDYWNSAGFLKKREVGQRNIHTPNRAKNACGSKPLHERYYELV
jgi:hypothetical protein